MSGIPQAPHALTDAETKALNTEQQELLKQCTKQTIEQCEFLIKQINADISLTAGEGNQLIHAINNGGFKLKLFRIHDANALDELNVQVVYDIHDDLFAYLKKPENLLPRRLRGFLDGGIDITKTADAAIDTDKQTGKQWTKVPHLDELLKKQRGLS